MWLRLGLERALLAATLRSVAQLALLGVVLEPVFRAQAPWLVAAALAIGAGGTALLGTAAIIGVDPWWEPRYLIPMLGMILGNGLTGISLGLDRCLQQLDEHRAQVDAVLTFGATPWEASRPVVAEGLRAGMIPILNSMTVVGLVTIPGMMTGQILGGTPPLQAAAYQMLILFLIAAATALGALLSVLLASRALFDEAGRLRPERITRSRS